MNDTLNKLTSHIRSSAALIASVAALVTSIRACTKPVDPTPAKAAFETLGTEVQHLSESQLQLYDQLFDLQALCIQNATQAPTIMFPAVEVSPTPKTVATPPKAAAKPKTVAKPKPWKAPDFDRMLALYEARAPEAPPILPEVVAGAPSPTPVAAAAPFEGADIPAASAAPTATAASAPAAASAR